MNFVQCKIFRTELQYNFGFICWPIKWTSCVIFVKFTMGSTDSKSCILSSVTLNKLLQFSSSVLFSILHTFHLLPSWSLECFYTTQNRKVGEYHHKDKCNWYCLPNISHLVIIWIFFLKKNNITWSSIPKRIIKSYDPPNSLAFLRNFINNWL
jgi:hypothetical protein